MGNPITTPPGRVFETADTAVVLVDRQTGKVTAVGVGTAQVSVRVNDVKSWATIVVLPVVKSVTATASTTQALVGDTIAVTASVIGWDGKALTNQPITYSSNSPTATVSSTGKVVFSAPGTAVITVKSGTATATVSLTALRREFIGGGLGSIASGDDATCGLLPLGQTFCFGRAPMIGIAKDTVCFGDATKGKTTACTLVPLKIAGQLQLTTVAAGDSVACGLNAQGRAYCWGDNSFGQIGNGVASPGTSALPTLVTGPLTSAANFSKIAAGRNHACALTGTGAAYCWGADSAYQLGTADSLRINSSTPIPVGGGNSYSAIAAGRAHTCAIRTADGAAICWGANARGQLGRGTFGDSLDVPAPVLGGVAFTQISAKGDFTCALSTATTIYCWGENSAGQTGQAPGITATPTAVAGSGYVAVTAGWAHACALTGAGAATCWGDDSYGQLGNGAAIGGGPSPSVVAGALTFSAISAGSRSTCAVAIDGAYCWGSSVYGATGNQIQALKEYVPRKTATPQ
jgi:alpha-tubulin suppressor-like RCC1 family protein